MGITIPERHAFVACTSETIVVGYHKFGLSIPFLDILLQESDPQMPSRISHAALIFFSILVPVA